MWGKESPNGMNICLAMSRELRHYYAYQLVSGGTQCCHCLPALGGCAHLSLLWLLFWLVAVADGDKGCWQLAGASYQLFGVLPARLLVHSAPHTADEQHKAPSRISSVPPTR